MSEQISDELVRADEVREGDIVWWGECWSLCDLAKTDRVLSLAMGETTLRLARNEGKGSNWRHGLSSSTSFLRRAAPVSDAKGREKLSRAIGLAESITRIPGLGYEVNKHGVYEIAAEIVELLRAVQPEMFPEDDNQKEPGVPDAGESAPAAPTEPQVDPNEPLFPTPDLDISLREGRQDFERRTKQ